jgi:hypothetical protein
MTKQILRLVVALTAIAAMGVGGVTLSGATTAHQVSGGESSTESTAPENSAADPDNVQYTAPGDADYQGNATARQSTRAAHAAQRGHHGKGAHRPARAAQSAPDPDEQSGENESSVESEQGQPGEPANGHQDAPGQDVNHECTGNCVE